MDPGFNRVREEFLYHGAGYFFITHVQVLSQDISIHRPNLPWDLTIKWGAQFITDRIFKRTMVFFHSPKSKKGEELSVCPMIFRCMMNQQLFGEPECIEGR
jgi:hypothetical protein